MEATGLGVLPHRSSSVGVKALGFETWEIANPDIEI
jgi:hypothetical protein